MTSTIHTFMGRRMLLVAEGGKLTMCNWTGVDKAQPTASPSTGEEAEILSMAVEQLDEYFAGRRREFSVPLEFHGTDFQKRVWKALLEIPYGSTVSYGELARRVGNPKGCRAVARACGANKLTVIVPCHRVTASGGSTGGYTGGIDIKLALLDVEKSATSWEAAIR